MSPRNSDTNSTPDVYVGLMFVSVFALLCGCIFLAMELGQYNWTVAP